ncbi:uncharacterized protein UV8b_07643 [Ustilaginoidea virens]|uniref:Uncharacterized protein n=1 Tax=Ustilaginoidea virens TaxID=1159556 RepID=A0A8E5MKQ4_USTVR|nr:uncharacterized protein UV8b_07643 [Ustilaginoidea virens]QUC23402.1 hypothetical protein UV8b_07643 [Ustilaginoidea virens]
MKTCFLAVLAGFAVAALAAPLDDASVAVGKRQAEATDNCNSGELNECANVDDPYVPSCPECVRSLGGECATWSFDYINNTWC